MIVGSGRPSGGAHDGQAPGGREGDRGRITGSGRPGRRWRLPSAPGGSSRGRAAGGRPVLGGVGCKLASALGSPERGRAFLASHRRHDRGITASPIRAASPASPIRARVAGYKLAGRALTGGSARDVLSVYGPLRGPPRLALLALLALFTRKPAEGEPMMDGICVAAALRGTGIGGLLLHEIVAVAADNTCSRIRLNVIDANPRASALYERHGFSAVHTRQTPFLRGLMGSLPSPPCTVPASELYAVAGLLGMTDQ